MRLRCFTRSSHILKCVHVMQRWHRPALDLQKSSLQLCRETSGKLQTPQANADTGILCCSHMHHVMHIMCW